MAAAKRAAPSLVDQLCNQRMPVSQPQHNRAQAAQASAPHQLSQEDAVPLVPQKQQQHAQDQAPGISQQQQQQQHGQEPLQGASQHQQQQQQHQSGQDPLQGASQHQQQHHQQHGQRRQQQQHSSAGLPVAALSSLRVKACDWKAALAAAPPACSARQGQSALSSGHAKALPGHLVPLLLPSLTQVLHCVAAAQLPVTRGLKVAVEAVGGLPGLEGGQCGLERVLVDAHAIERGCSAGELDAILLASPPLYQTTDRLACVASRLAM